MLIYFYIFYRFQVVFSQVFCCLVSQQLWVLVWMWKKIASLLPWGMSGRRLGERSPCAHLLCFRQPYQIGAGLGVKYDILTGSLADRFLAGLSATLELLLSMWWKSVFNCTSCGEVNKTKEETQKSSQQKASGLAHFSSFKQHVRELEPRCCLGSETVFKQVELLNETVRENS